MCKIELYKNLTKWSYFLLLTHVNVRLISDPLFSCSSLSDKSDFDRSVNFVMDQIREPGFFIFRTLLCGGPIVISLFARKNVYGAYIYILSPIWLITTKCLWAKSVQWHWNKIMHQRWRSYQTCVNFLSGRFSPYPLNSICLIFLTCKEPFHEG